MFEDMEEAEALAFLAAGTRTGKLATATPGGVPHAVPVWFVIDGADVAFTTRHDSVKGRNRRLNALTRAGRFGLLLGPPLAYWLTYRLCLGLQQHDREVLAHGIETRILRRTPEGGFIEVHQPQGVQSPRYAGWVVPKKINRIGALAPAVKGFFFPVERPARPPVAPPAGRPAELPAAPADEVPAGRP